MLKAISKIYLDYHALIKSQILSSQNQNMAVNPIAENNAKFQLEFQNDRDVLKGNEDVK